MFMYLLKYACVYARTCVCTSEGARVYKFKHVRARACVFVCVCMRECVLCVYVCMFGKMFKYLNITTSVNENNFSNIRDFTEQNLVRWNYFTILRKFHRISFCGCGVTRKVKCLCINI